MTDQEFVKTLPNVETFYVIFSNYTRMPYIECDEEDFIDKIYIFINEDKAKEFCESYKEKKQPLTPLPVPQQGAMTFFSSLIADGVDSISFCDEEMYTIPVTNIITRTLKEGMQQPIENPSLQISMMYFLQNARGAETPEEKMAANRYEEEMMANIARAIYLVPFNDQGEKDENGNQKIALMQIQNQNKETFIPLFTDVDEFRKMNPNAGTTQFIPMGFKQISKSKVKGLSGYVINPASVNLQMNQANIMAVEQRFGDQAK